MAVGDVSQALVAGVAEEREGALAELASGGTGEATVEGIEFGQQASIVVGIASGEGFSWGTASVEDSPGDGTALLGARAVVVTVRSRDPGSGS